MQGTSSQQTQPATQGEEIIAEILELYPCPECGAVEVLRDAPIFGATCDCGRKEGCQTRWELGDIWPVMSDEQRSAATAAEAEIMGDKTKITLPNKCLTQPATQGKLQSIATTFSEVAIGENFSDTDKCVICGWNRNAHQRVTLRCPGENEFSETKFISAINTEGECRTTKREENEEDAGPAGTRIANKLREDEEDRLESKYGIND